ncbi:MAG: phosphoribosyltransferase family protein, partial [Pseudomonadota bacterium]|nr:phosphoribosyltransferase family protein [Pseudomonadota bacterium]
HGDRLDLMGPAARGMARAGGDLVQSEMLVTAIPLHWRRRVKRRYNQSVELGRRVARLLDLDFCPDVLIRPRATPVLDGKSPTDRLRALDGALVLNPARQGLIAGRPVLLVDDVMTSGATLSVASRALTQGGAANVRVLTLARAVKEA